MNYLKKLVFKNYDIKEQEYFGSKELKNIYKEINIDNYYDPVYEKYEINGDSETHKDENVELYEYLNKIRPNLTNLIRDKQVNQRKVQLVVLISFYNILNEDTTEKYIHSDNLEIISTDDPDEVVIDLFNSLIHRYQETLREKMQGTNFVYDYVVRLDIKFNTVNLIRGSSYIESPYWLQAKKLLLIVRTLLMVMNIALHMQLQ